MTHAPNRGPSMMAATAPAQAPDTSLARYTKFEDVIALLEESRAGTLLIEAKQNIRIAKFSPGRIEFQPWDNAANDLAARLADRLHALTGTRWVVSIADAPDDARTAYEVEHAHQLALEDEARAHPTVAKVFELFPDATFGKIRTPESMAQEAAVEALQEVEDEWDPFEED